MTTKILIAIVLLAAVLRLWNLSAFPAGLNADEAALGYNAYSLLQTGADEYGAKWPLVFKSFGDYKPGLFVYFIMPFVATLGLTELAVRLPSALFGVATVWMIYFLGKEVFKDKRVGLAAALLLAITPWHIHFSRGGWESNVATFFMTLGVYLFLRGLKVPKYLWWSLFSFLLSMYIYQSPRLVVPVLLIGVLVFYKNELWQLRKKLITKKSLLIVGLLFLLSLPLVLQFTSGSGSARFAGLSFLADQGPLSRINEIRGEHTNPQSKDTVLLHNKLTAYGPEFLRHYLDHFRSDFLFIIGDEIIRNRPPETGQFYLLEALFLAVGLFYLVGAKNTDKRIVLWWLLVAPLASSMTFQTPNALRSLNMVIPFVLIMSFGLVQMLSWPFRKIIMVLVTVGLLFEGSHYLESYFIHYPLRTPIAWEYGFSEMVTKLQKYQDKYDQVIITDRYDQPYILVLFYEKYNPEKYQPQATLTERDKFNFGTVRAFDKYQFHSIKSDEIEKVHNTLFIGTPQEIDPRTKTIDQVNFPDGTPAFLFVEKI